MVLATLAAAGCSGAPTPATNVTRVTATLNAKAQCSEDPCSWYFRYGTDGLYQHQTPAHEVASSSGGGPVQVPGENVKNLVPGTTYQFQLCGKGDGASQYECVGPDGSRSTSEQFTTQDSKADCLYSANKVSTLVGFGERVGHAFQCAMTFVNAAQKWTGWETPWITTAGRPSSEDTNWQAWKNCANPEDPCAAGERRQLIITTELWPSSEDNNDSLARCSEGNYDLHATLLATNLVKDGLGDSIIRIQPEGNDTSRPADLPSDGVNGWPTTQEEQEWATCWRNEALAMKSVPGGHFLMDWTVNAFWRPIPFVGWYPGDRAVDIIGIDAYDRGLPSSITSEPTAWNWIYGQPDGIGRLQQFAAQHGKPMGFSEWGLSRRGSPESGLGDDPTYVDRIAAAVRLLHVAYQSYFLNGEPGALLDGFAPMSFARYVAHFGGSGDTRGNPTIVAPPGPTPVATALTTAANPAPAGTVLTFTANVAPTPDSGAVTFTDGGAPISGCSGIGVSIASAGAAVCRTAFASAGAHNVVASYSGDALYAPSVSPALAESITTAAGSGTSGRSSARRPRGPVISHVSISPDRFRVRHTTTVRLTVSEPATITVAVTRLRHGHMARHHCSTKAHRGKPCMVRVTLARRRFHARAGRNAVKLSFPHLAAARYVASVHATDRAGRSRRMIRIKITILPRS